MKRPSAMPWLMMMMMMMMMMGKERQDAKS